LNRTRPDAEAIKNRINIVDVVSEHVVLKKAGRNYSGLCPFHKEKTPSFTVSEEKQIFYCFGCGAGGDVFSFLMNIQNLTFPEAMSQLAAKAGIPLPEKRAERPGAEGKIRQDVLRLNRLASEFFTKNLYAPAGKTARDYLQKRGMKQEAAAEFRLGYAPPGWRVLREHLESRGVPLALAEKAGLLARGERGDLYDRFRNRLIFPIEDLRGEIIAFGGRAFGEDTPKYLNSPESPVYIKGRNLYLLNKAREGIRKKGCLILVEGYFDALSLWSKGVTNVSATLGTALTRDHLSLIRRYTDEVVAIFDPDEGGRSALERSLKLFLAERIRARIVLLPDRLDPDDYIKAHGAEGLEALIKESRSIVDYYIDNVIGAGGKDFESSLGAVREAVAFISQIEEPLQKNLFIKRVSELLGIDQGLLKAEISRTVRKKPGAVSPEKRREQSLTDRVEKGFLQMLIESPERIRQAIAHDVFSYFLSPELRKIGEAIRKRHDDGDPVRPSDLLSEIEDESFRESCLKKWAGDGQDGSESGDRIFSDTIKKIKLRWFKRKHGELKKKLLEAQRNGDADRCRDLLLEKEGLLKLEKSLRE